MSGDREKFEARMLKRWDNSPSTTWKNEDGTYVYVQSEFEAWTASRLQALEEAAKELETLSKPSALLLAAGEMTAQEMRTARAIAARFVAALRAMKETP